MFGELENVTKFAADSPPLNPHEAKAVILAVISRAPEREGQLPEWPNGADCNSAGLRLRWFESITAHSKSVNISLFTTIRCLCSSAVEHFLGKEEVPGSSPGIGSDCG